jgi:hypothetical protein
MIIENTLLFEGVSKKRIAFQLRNSSNSAHRATPVSIKFRKTPHSVKYCTVYSQVISLQPTFFKPADSHSRVQYVDKREELNDK